MHGFNYVISYLYENPDYFFFGGVCDRFARRKLACTHLKGDRVFRYHLDRDAHGPETILTELFKNKCPAGGRWCFLSVLRCSVCRCALKTASGAAPSAALFPPHLLKATARFKKKKASSILHFCVKIAPASIYYFCCFPSVVTQRLQTLRRWQINIQNILYIKPKV